MASEVLALFKQPEAMSGREAELSALQREHEDARTQGRARFVFVRGPAGVGKSHLFRLFRAQVASCGGSVFESDSPREVRRPFGVFAGMLSHLLEHLGHAGLPEAQLALLSRRVAPVTRGTQVPEAQRLDLFDAASELFVLAGRESPVFLFPDVDAADKSSLELFRYLAAVVTAPESAAGGLFVASFREDTTLPAPLSDVLSRVSARTLPLSGLDLEGIRAFLARAEVAQKLFEATGGMPDALEELLTRPAPAPVELFSRRVDRLADDGRELLATLAVAPQALSLQILSKVAAILGAPPLDGIAAQLDALVREHVVTVRHIGGESVYRFSREQEKLAFADGLSVERSDALRRALARSFEEGGELVVASELLAQVSAAEAAPLSVRAAEQLAGCGADEEARELFERALPYVNAEEKARLHAQLAKLAKARADQRRVVFHLSRARLRSGAAPAVLCERAARSLIQLGRLGMAERLLQGVALRGELAARASASIGQVEILLLRGHTEAAISLAQASLAGLEEHPEQLIALRNALGRAWLLKGELDRAAAAFEQNREHAESLQLAGETARAWVNLGVVAHKKSDRDGAIRCYQAAAPGGDRVIAAKALANLGSIYAEAGEFELALDNLSRALQTFSRLGSAREVAHAASNLARAYAFLGDGTRAAELSGYALDRARELGETYLQASALLNQGEIALDRRDLGEAARLLTEARDLFIEVGSTGLAALATAEKARAHLLAGERAQASAELERPVVERGASELPTAQVEVELVRGELALMLGDLHGAGRAMTRAREALLEKPDLEGPYRVYFLMGKVRLAAGDASGAQAEMSRAARLLDQLTERVPASRRHAFLSVPRRAEVLGAVEPELRMPHIVRTPLTEAASHGLVGQAAALSRITRQIEPIARANTTVLIRGESGTGKEVLAQAIHDRSPRRGMPIIKVNCAAMVEDLLLSELFGHEKGAFTGAIRERKGRFELADGGTLFLDEIGDISPRAQVALLRVLQEREFERVGGTKTIKVDVRVICATNRDLETLIAQGRFRQDLYYRLKGVMLELPPLRERLEDLPQLAQHFLTRVARDRNEAPKQLSQASLELLGRHTWPGNVRELENVLSSAAIFAGGQLITPECFSHIAELTVLEEGASQVSTTARPLVLPPSQPVEPARLSAQPVASPSPAPATAPEDDEQDEDSPSPGAASVDDIDFYALARTRDLSLKDLRHQLEMQCIKRALLEAKGNISEAGRLLKMKRSRLSQIVNAEPELKGVCGD